MFNLKKTRGIRVIYYYQSLWSCSVFTILIFFTVFLLVKLFLFFTKPNVNNYLLFKYKNLNLVIKNLFDVQVTW